MKACAVIGSVAIIVAVSSCKKSSSPEVSKARTIEISDPTTRENSKSQRTMVYNGTDDNLQVLWNCNNSQALTKEIDLNAVINTVDQLVSWYRQYSVDVTGADCASSSDPVLLTNVFSKMKKGLLRETAQMTSIRIKAVNSEILQLSKIPGKHSDILFQLADQSQKFLETEPVDMKDGVSVTSDSYYDGWMSAMGLKIMSILLGPGEIFQINQDSTPNLTEMFRSVFTK